MNYHIDTGLIKQKFSESCNCPLCEIKKIVEEEFLYEFLNDAVMEDNSRIAVGRKGFCKEHFYKLLARQNKLSVALQIGTRVDVLKKLLEAPKSAGSAKKISNEIDKSMKTCVVCDLVEGSMIKYYKTTAQLFARETEFAKTLLHGNGFCMQHYAQLLKYSSSAGFASKSYLEILSKVQNKGIETITNDLKAFCDKHDYRNANKPLTEGAENSLVNIGEKLFGKEYE